MLFVAGISFTPVCRLLTGARLLTPMRGRSAVIAACSRRPVSRSGRLATRSVDARQPARSVWHFPGAGAALPVPGALRQWGVPGSVPSRQHWVTRAYAHWLLAPGSRDVIFCRCVCKLSGGFPCGRVISRTRGDAGWTHGPGAGWYCGRIVNNACSGRAQTYEGWPLRCASISRGAGVV